MKHLWLIAGLILLLACDGISVETEVTTNTLPEQEPWEQQIDSLMARQENAWNNGDLQGFMQPYLKSDSLLFIGSRGLSYGWKQTLLNYKKSYPDKEAMGTLHFENDEYKKLGAENALVIGRWHLYRTADTLQGTYSLNWQLVDGEWKIIADHSS